MNPVPPMVKRLLIINAAISVISLIAMQTVPDAKAFIIQHLALTPHRVLQGEVWQLFTYLFLHLEPFHLLFNLLFLWVAGSTFEPKWGSRSFLKFFIISGIGSGVGVMLAGLGFAYFDQPTVGMSGALNAILMAFAVLYPEQPVYLYGMLPLKGKHLVLLVVGIDILFALAGSSASLPAHMTGLLMGYLLITGKWRPSRWVRAKKRPKPRGPSNLRIVKPRDDDDEAPPDKRWLN